MNLYEHTIIAKQNFTKSQLDTIKDKYTNLIKKIGYLPKTTIKKGISNFVDWYKSYNK